MSATASLSRSARPAAGRAVLTALLAAGLLAAACGGGGDGAAPAPAESDTAGAQSQAMAPAAAADEQGEAAEPESDTLTLPTVDLSRLLVQTVGVAGHGLLRVVSAQPADPAQLLAGLRGPDGAATDTEALVQNLGIEGAFQAVYSGAQPDRLQVVTIDVLGFEGAGGAAALLDLIRAQPPEPGQRVVAPPADLSLDPVRITVYDVLDDPNPPTEQLVVGLHRTALLTVSGSVMVRVEFLGGVPDPLPDVSSLATVAAQVVERIATAEAGGEPGPVLALPFPRVELTTLPDRLPTEFQGFQPLPPDGDATRVVARYASPSGDLLIAVIEAFGNAAALRLRDVAILQPQGLPLFTGAGPAGWELLDAEPLPSAAEPGVLGSGGRWHVRVDEVELYDDVLAFQRGTVWVILQGVSAEAGGTPVIDFAFLLDDLLVDLTGVS